MEALKEMVVLAVQPQINEDKQKKDNIAKSNVILFVS